MNRSVIVRGRSLVRLLAILLFLCACTVPATAQRVTGIPMNKGGMRDALHPVLPAIPISAAWDDPAAVEKGEAMITRLIDAAGGWEEYLKLGGFRYDMLATSKMNSYKGKNPWVVHHYEPRLCHFNVEKAGYVYSEWAKPSLTGPDFMREIMFDKLSWREMRGGFLRTAKSYRTARSRVRLERLTGTMPYSLKSMRGRLAFMREEQSEIGKLEMYALRLPGDMMINYYPWMVEDFGQVYEFHLIVDPVANSVVQMRFAFPDSTVAKAPHIRWWTMDFEGKQPVGEKCFLPHRRYLWLDGWNELDELLIEDVVVERIPPSALRRPWQSGNVYLMPYRCDFWDPPKGVEGLTGHDTGLEDLPAGRYPPGHPKYEGPELPFEDPDAPVPEMGGDTGGSDKP